MSKRSQWCDVSKELRKYILNRDKECVNCGAKKPLTMAHIFLSRSKGGKGCKENIVALCNNCHYFLLDNPIGKKNIEKSKEILAKCYQHLFNVENVIYNDEFINSLKYHKVYGTIKLESEKKDNKCCDCQYLIKRNSKISTLPVYYCQIEKKIKAKKSVACNNFKNNH